jgi:HEPN domain-containing protein
MNRADLQRLSRLRLQEARSLFKLKHYSGAYYLAGYSVECALKACLARDTRRFDFPDKELVLKSYTHKPAELLRVAGLLNDFQTAIKTLPNLEGNWNIVIGWSEQSRYAVWSRADAHAMIDAVGRRQEGVLPWLHLHW